MDNNLIHSEIKISFDNNFITKLYDVTPTQIKLLRELAIQMQGKLDKVLLRKLEKILRKKIPIYHS